MGQNPSFDFSHLSLEERLQLVEDLWDSIAESAEADRAFPMTEEFKAELDRRLEEHRRDPESAIPWEDVRDELLARRKRGG